MNEIKILELDKILSLLSERCVSEPAKEKALTLLPFESIEKCRASLEETDAAYVLYKKFSAPSFSGLSDISAILKKAERGAILSISDFLRIGRVLRISRLLGEYCVAHVTEGVLMKYLEKFTPNKYLEDKIFADFPSEEKSAIWRRRSQRHKKKNSSREK